jgi:hypothetical protein
MSSYKIKGPIPTGESNVEILADYFEIQALCRASKEVSIKDVLKQLLKPVDDQNDNGIEDQEDRINNKLELVIEAIQRRIDNSRGNYPFKIIFEGNVILFNGFSSFASYLYVYLLFATRLNMNTHKKFEDLDGTKLFEEISALVAQTYFGERSRSMVFGTALDGGFERKVNDLCNQLNEGGCFFNHGKGEVTENDDALDIVVWNHFEDKLANKLIGFGQCKTGTSYESHRKDLQPEEFCKKWIQTQLNQNPVRLFFITDIVERERFWKRSVDAGIMFDRIRIMDFLPKEVALNLEQNITDWSQHALDFACS